jgi:3-(methylthio)propanoyl-CoA dehydrogenase
MYRAPIKETLFVLNDLLRQEELAGLPGLEDYSAELAESVLSEAARFAETELAPLNRPGDEEGARWTPEGVVTPKGFRDAYLKFVEGGWPQLAAEPEFGGQGVPNVLNTAVQEFWASSNLAFKLCPMLTQGAIEALQLSGTEQQKRLFLPKMVSGEWTGTMCLTEPQAGSDLGRIRTRAVPQGDHYRLFGQKIFLTWGEHDYTENIVHMVLARIEGAPAGVRGISLFIVPKMRVNADGSLGANNEVKCLKIEEKLGIHASPTCVMQYGEKEGAIGYLVGEANRGLEYMFIMMNAARLSVGLEGYAMAERAFQQALGWARDRIQGIPPVANDGSKPLPIAHHPDVKRMLLTMKATTEAMRALALYTAFQFDLAAHVSDEPAARAAQARAELLIPIVKGWCTETGIEIASLGVQVHGGMGYVEETGAAQYYRDSRITTIYEGTTGIQSNDLIGRKMGRDRGAAISALILDAVRELEALDATDAEVGEIRKSALEAVALLRDSAQSVLKALAADPAPAFAVSVPLLRMCGIVLGGWLMARAGAVASAKLAAGGDREFLEGKLRTARFYADHVLPQAHALARIVKGGAPSVLETDPSLL